MSLVREKYPVYDTLGFTSWEPRANFPLASIEDLQGTPVSLSFRTVEAKMPKKVPIACVDGKYFIDKFDKARYYATLKALLPLKESNVSATIDVELRHYPDQEYINEHINAVFGIPEHDATPDITGEGYMPVNRPNRPSFSLGEATFGKVEIIKSGVFGYLTNYVTSTEIQKKVPLIAGHTGLGKTAVVKAVVVEANKNPLNTYGYRFVDLRAGFMDKIDFAGRTTTSQIDIGGELVNVFQNAPNYEILTATDKFVEKCRQILKDVDASRLGPEELKDLDVVREFAKTPVVFIDELNRCPRNILDIIMLMLSDKHFSGYLMTGVRFITAANLVFDSEAELQNFYQTELIEDLAHIDRFVTINMDYKDVTILNSSKVWLIEKYPVCKKYIEMAWNNGIAYDPTLGKPEAQGVDNKFPTFRAWEFVCQYLDARIKNNMKKGGKWTILGSVISGFIGRRAAAKFIPLISEDFVVDNPEDEMSAFIDHCYQAGLPSMLVGRAGVAKSARVYAKAHAGGALIKPIQLSSQDRTTIRGYPQRADLTKVLLGEKGGHIATLLQDELDKDPYAPKQTTKFSEDIELRQLVEEAKATDKPLILFVDEINRCQPVVMSGVFDIVSEKKFLGVDLSGVNVKVIAAGNVNTEENKNHDAEDMDAATFARFCVFEKNSVDDKDIKILRQFAQKKFSPVINMAMAKLTNAQMKAMINEVPETPSLTSGMSSFRTFEALDHELKNLRSKMVFAFDPGTYANLPVKDFINLTLTKDWIGWDTALQINVGSVKFSNGDAFPSMSLLELKNYLSKNMARLSDQDLVDTRTLLMDVDDKISHTYIASALERTGYRNNSIFATLVAEVGKSYAQTTIQELMAKIKPSDDIGKWIMLNKDLAMALATDAENQTESLAQYYTNSWSQAGEPAPTRQQVEMIVTILRQAKMNVVGSPDELRNAFINEFAKLYGLNKDMLTFQQVGVTVEADVESISTDGQMTANMKMTTSGVKAGANLMFARGRAHFRDSQVVQHFTESLTFLGGGLYFYGVVRDIVSFACKSTQLQAGTTHVQKITTVKAKVRIADDIYQRRIARGEVEWSPDQVKLQTADYEITVVIKINIPVGMHTKVDVAKHDAYFNSVVGTSDNGVKAWAEYVTDNEDKVTPELKADIETLFKVEGEVNALPFNMIKEVMRRTIIFRKSLFK